MLTRRTGRADRGTRQPSGDEHHSTRYMIRAVTRSVTICVIALVAVGLAGAVTLSAAVIDATQRIEPAARANAQILQFMTDSETAIRGYQLTHQTGFLAPLDAAVPGLHDATGRLSSLLAPESRIEVDVDLQERLVQAWEVKYAQPVLAGRRLDLDPAQLVSARLEFDQIRAVNARIGAWSEARRHALALLAIITAGISCLTLLGAGVLGLTLGLRPARRALNAVVPPLEALDQIVRRLHARDFTARADPGVGVIEIRTVAGALNELAAGQQLAERRMSEELRLTALERDWGTAAHSVTDVGDLLNESLVPLRQGMNASVIWIRVFEGTPELPGKSSLLMYPTITEWQSSPARLVELAGRLAQLSWHQQQPFVMYADEPESEFSVAPEMHEGFLDAVGRVGARSLLLAGLGAGDGCLGYLAFGRPADAPAWSVMEIRTIQRMAKEIGLAVANVRAFEREQELVAELQAVDASKNSFVSMVSHELRTPLASVMGHLDIVRSGELGRVDPSVDRSLAAMERNTLRLAGLIEDLLLLSQVEHHDQPSVLEPIDVGEMVEHSLQTVRPAADRAGVGIDVDLPDDLPKLHGNAVELERVVDNLMANAIKFSPRGSRVELTAEIESGDPQTLAMSVCDHGLGISTVDQQSLFTRFFRSTNPTAQAIPGTGLGLSICKIIVERHGGTIAVDSQLGRGTKMTVRLPITDSDRAGG